MLIGFGVWLSVTHRWRAGLVTGWACVAISIFWALGVWAFLWEAETLVVRRVEVVSRTWAGPPLRIGVIADIHMAAPHMTAARLKSIVARMNAEQPDVVLLLGDFAGDEEPAAVRADPTRSMVLKGLTPLRALKARFGVWAVLGNHDWWDDGEAIEAQLTAQNVQVLENAAARVARPGGPFWIGGLADYDSKRQLPSYLDTLSHVDGPEPVIVMSHWPDPFGAAPERVALTLAGHTHCGQVNLPYVGRLFAASEGAEKWPCGLYEERGRKLYVSGGGGVSIVPVRFNQPPEIAVLTLRAD
jgi:uncharacterized protein